MRDPLPVTFLCVFLRKVAIDRMEPWALITPCFHIGFVTAMLSIAITMCLCEKPREQLYIILIVFIVPIYALNSFVGIWWAIQYIWFIFWMVWLIQSRLSHELRFSNSRW